MSTSMKKQAINNELMKNERYTCRQVFLLTDPKTAPEFVGRMLERKWLPAGLLKYADWLKKGVVPVSIDRCRNGGKEENVFMPYPVNIFASYVPLGSSFENGKSGSNGRYDGYHVSKDPLTGLKILRELEKTLPDENGKEVKVSAAKNPIVLTRVDIINGRSTLISDYDEKENVLLVKDGPDATSICTSFVNYEGKTFIPEKALMKAALKSEDNTVLMHLRWRYNVEKPGYVPLYRLDAKWNGFITDALGADHQPSDRFGMLIYAGGENEPKAVLGLRRGLTWEEYADKMFQSAREMASGLRWNWNF